MVKSIELPSGTWEAYVLTVVVNRKPVGTHVELTRNNGDSLMQVRAGDNPTRADVERAAREPLSRELVVGEARWTFHSTAPQAGPRAVVFWSKTEGGGTGDLPDGLSLGEVADEDLHVLVATGRQI